ncbi:LD-carboxypeptidase [Halobacillus fulvus]|nr:LD-carboxypeptidase [Halobacillus fulvus]
MYPEKLKPGQEVRVISPAESLSMIAHDQRELAIQRLETLGVTVTYSQYAEVDEASVEQRVHDLHEAFLDPNVAAIMTTIGGYNSNQLLCDLDYELIRRNPKILCGFSDITALSNAIHKKTGLVTYSGPHFSSFGMKEGIDYTWSYFRKVMTEKAPFEVEPADHWSDDAWYLDQDNRTFYDNEGYRVLQKGKATGKSLGGNLCTFNLLQGTPFMPDLEDSILFLEDDLLTDPKTFDRDLQSLLHQPDFHKVRGLVIGRFQKESDISLDKLKKIIETKKELEGMPIIVNASFGHTTPRFTFPIGGSVTITADSFKARIVLNHY